MKIPRRYQGEIYSSRGICIVDCLRIETITYFTVFNSHSQLFFYVLAFLPAKIVTRRFHIDNVKLCSRVVQPVRRSFQNGAKHL